MRNASVKSDQMMFGELLAYLRQHGFSIGVDHYIRLQHLLDRIGGHCAPDELRTLLCPIFATSKTQQEQFYRAFDSYFDFFQLPDEQAELEQSAEATQTPVRSLRTKRARAKWLYVATPAALAMLVIAFALFLRQKPAEQPATNQASATPTPDIAATPSESTITVEVNEADATASTVTPTPMPAPTPAPASTPQPSFYQRYRNAVHLAIILAPLLLFLLYEWYRFARRRLLLEKQQTRKPPFVWPIRVDAPDGGLHDSEQFLTAARLMRRRQVDEFRRLDIEATVAATVERLGFPDFRYKSDSRVPEYLVLIDRAAPRDHQARLFDELTRALEREGVFVVRYFFDGEPRVCRDETGAGVVQLAELQNRFGSHRLIIFSSGEKLLDPITGRLDGWTAVFNHWQDRALLTIENPARWGLREIALAQMFVVLPATFNGLLALVDYFETTVPADLRSRARGGFAMTSSETTPEETIAALRRSLGEETLQWLSACALYTELHWNLTLYIGSLPSMPSGLVKEENLLKLVRLPWFRAGAIPDEVRWLLLNELTPERQSAVRSAIIELLEKDPAPPGTFASDQYRLNLFAQRWLQSRTRKRLRELLELMKRLPSSQVVRDLTLVRFLESSSRSPLDFLLPDRLRKFFYHRGIPSFGLKTGARFLITLLVMGIAWIGIKTLSPSGSNLVENIAQATQPADPGKNPNDPSAVTPPTSPEIKNQNQSSDDGDQPSPLIAKDQEQQPQREIPGQTPEVFIPNEAGKTPALPTGTLAGSGTEKGVTSVPGIFGNSTQQSGQPLVLDDTPPPPPPVATPTTAPKTDAPYNVGSLKDKARSIARPFYPRSLALQASGIVQVEIILDESGKVISARATSGSRLLHQSAVEAAYKSVFRPILINGQPVKARGFISYNFAGAPPLETDENAPQGPQRQPGPRRQPQPPPGRRPQRE